MIDIISLGAGVQSSTMALMAEVGELRKPHCAIFADTQDEPDEVYHWLDWLEARLSYPVYRVTAGKLSKASTELRVSKRSGETYMRLLVPAYVAKPNGDKALMSRKCTVDFKLRQIFRKAKEVAMVPRGCKSPIVFSWIGISTDEAHRMTTSKETWAQNTYPLIDKGMSRNDCLAWMKQHGFPEPPKSACVFCPFHSDASWLRFKNDKPEEFAKAVRFDTDLRETARKQTGIAKLQGDVFLHSSLVPLGEVKFSDVPERLQTNLFGNECKGMCGV
jgi:hypothetical protein